MQRGNLKKEETHIEFHEELDIADYCVSFAEPSSTKEIPYEVQFSSSPRMKPTFIGSKVVGGAQGYRYVFEMRSNPSDQLNSND